MKWRQMAARVVVGILLALVPVLATPPTRAMSNPRTTGFEIRGACYCRAAGRLTCVADLGRPECDKRCAEALCDDWFWIERRPCWDWGYGG